MLEVVFSDSARGSLIVAQHYGAGEYHSGCIGIIGHHADGSPLTEAEVQTELEKAEARERAAWERAVPLGGRPDDVFAFSLALSVGDIRAEDFARRRQETLERLWSIDADGKERAAERLRKAQTELERLKDRLQGGEALRIWYGDQPEDRCGLSWLMAELQPWKLPKREILLVKLPEWEQETEDVLIQHNGWGDIEPGKWHRYLPLAKPAPHLLCRQLAAQWRELQEEHAPLRGMLNGRLVSLPENAYDSFLLRELDKMPERFWEARLIGQVLGKYALGIGDGLLHLRVEQLMQAGLLEVETPPEPGDIAYRRTLRKRGSL